MCVMEDGERESWWLKNVGSQNNMSEEVGIVWVWVWRGYTVFMLYVSSSSHEGEPYLYAS